MAKEYYSKYLADDRINLLNIDLVNKVLDYKPESVFEFGAGQGKNLSLIHEVDPKIFLRGIDISVPAVLEANNMGRDYIYLDDETLLSTWYSKFDVSFTCSVLDHIDNKLILDQIIKNLKRITNKAIILVETLYHNPSEYYYGWEYESWGFKKLDWKSVQHPNQKGDGHYYHMFVYEMYHTSKL